METLAALFKALPTLVGLFSEVVKFLKGALGDDPAKYIRDSHDAFKTYNGATDEKEKRQGLRKIRRLIDRL